MTSPNLQTVAAGDRVLEITNIESGEVAHRTVVTRWSERMIDKLTSGMLINLDHENWYVRDHVIGEKE